MFPSRRDAFFSRRESHKYEQQHTFFDTPTTHPYLSMAALQLTSSPCDSTTAPTWKENASSAFACKCLPAQYKKERTLKEWEITGNQEIPIPFDI